MTCTLQGPNSCLSRRSTSSCAADCCARCSTVSNATKSLTPFQMQRIADQKKRRDRNWGQLQHEVFMLT